MNGVVSTCCEAPYAAVHGSTARWRCTRCGLVCGIKAGEPEGVLDEGGSMTKQKTLDLKVTVEAPDPDGTLAKMLSQTAPVLAGGVYALTVTHVERADGQAIGAEAAFEEYWEETHTGREGTDWSSGEKLEALDAFLYGLRYAKEKKA